MSDKDLLVVVAEMLRKQDQHSAILNQQSATINEIKDALSNFIDVSVIQFEKQDNVNAQFLMRFEKQDSFNEQLLSKLDEISKKL